MLTEDARCKIEALRIHYNKRHPRSALRWLTR
ncbi:integrase core domain-containing protein [Pantoea coffeiphila]